jgi:membrane protease subunit (stomatin/prohibitin family)
VTLSDFLSKQFIRVIQWNETEDGVLACRYPMQDMEIENGGRLTVRETQMAAFINEGRIADVFGPGLYTLNTRNLPILTDLLNWTKDFESPFKSDVYFFSIRLQISQKWGTGTPVTIRDKEFGAVRLRAYGTYAYRIADPRAFFTNVSGTRDTYYATDLEDQLHAMILERMAGAFADSNVAFLDMAHSQAALADTIAAAVKPGFAAFGLEMNQFVVESVSLPDELQKVMDQRIGMGMAGDVGRLTQFEAAESLEEAAQNPGGTAGMGVGLGAGMTIAQAFMKQASPAPAPAAVHAAPEPEPDPEFPVQHPHAKFCVECGAALPQSANFCPACGTQL